MTISAWPEALAPSTIGRPDLRSSMIAGTRTTAGTEQRVFSSAGRWEIRYTIPVMTRAKVLAYSAVMDRLRSGESVVLKVFDMHRAEGFGGAEPVAELVSSVSAGATSAQIDASGLTLEIGVHFSIGQRLYRINRVTAEIASDSLVDIILSEEKPWADAADWVEDGSHGSRYSITFLPPLRAAASSGATVEFTDLVCLCDLKDVTAGDLDLDMGKFGTAQLTFVEAR